MHTARPPRLHAHAAFRRFSNAVHLLIDFSSRPATMKPSISSWPTVRSWSPTATARPLPRDSRSPRCRPYSSPSSRSEPPPFSMQYTR